jgi:hypothetical protein
MSSTSLPAVSEPGARKSSESTAPGAEVRRDPEVRPLRNRNLGLLCRDPEAAQPTLLRQAATGLGARVALVRCDLDEGSGRAALEHTARVLGRLYDAVVCIDLPPPIVEQLVLAAGVPVISDEAPAWRELHADEATALEGARRLLVAQLASL